MALPKFTLFKSHPFLGYVLVVCAAVGFSAKAVLIKLAYLSQTPVDSITLMLWRMALSLPFFLGVALWSAKSSAVQRLSLKDWFYLLVLGFLGYYLASWLDFEGLRYISAGLERLLLFLYPTFVVLLTALLKRQALRARQMAALSLSYAGMALVFGDHYAIGGGVNLLWGSALVLASALSYACFLLGSGMMIQRIGATRFTAYSMTVACGVTCMHYVWVHGLQLAPLTQQLLIWLVLMALFSTVLPAFMLNAGIRLIGADAAAIVSGIGPVGTLILAYGLLHESVSLIQMLGTLLILTGIFLVVRFKT